MHNWNIPQEPYMLAVIIIGAALLYVVISLLRTHTPREVLDIFTGKTGPRKEVAGWAVRAGDSFELAYRPSGGKTLRFFLGYDVAYRWDSACGGDDESAFGLAVRAAVTAPGRPVQEVSLGIGGDIPAGVKPFTGILHRTRFSRSGEACRSRATVHLGLINDLPADSEIRVTGTITASPNISSAALRMFFTR